MQAFFLLFNILFFTFHVDDHGRNAASDAENGKDNDVGHSPSVVFETKYQVNIMIAAGVSLILIGIILMLGLEPILSSKFTDTSIDSDELMSSIFLFFVTIAVTIIVYAGMQKEKYEIKHYNLMHDKESEERKYLHAITGIRGEKGSVLWNLSYSEE